MISPISIVDGRSKALLGSAKADTTDLWDDGGKADDRPLFHNEGSMGEPIIDSIDWSPLRMT